MEGDATYFSRRASQEREAALKAAHPNARQAHLDLAHRYDDLAHSINERDKHLGLNLNAPAALAGLDR
jgi:hypothetical protein